MTLFNLEYVNSASHAPEMKILIQDLLSSSISDRRCIFARHFQPMLVICWRSAALKRRTLLNSMLWILCFDDLIRRCKTNAYFFFVNYILRLLGFIDDMIWFDLIAVNYIMWYDVIRYDMIWYNNETCYMIWYDLIAVILLLWFYW